jgi:hypothetical protein
MFSEVVTELLKLEYQRFHWYWGILVLITKISASKSRTVCCCSTGRVPYWCSTNLYFIVHKLNWVHYSFSISLTCFCSTGRVSGCCSHGTVVILNLWPLSTIKLLTFVLYYDAVHEILLLCCSYPTLVQYYTSMG